MQIYCYPNYTYQNNKVFKQTSFKAGTQYLKTINNKKSFNRLEYVLRVLGNRISDLFQSKTTKMITLGIASLTPKQDRVYLEQLAEIGRLYASQKIIDINVEDKILEQIAQKGDSTIFMLTHSNQAEDPQMLAVLNTLLSEAYKDVGAETFPLPKIILNEDILKTMNPTKRKAFENFGAIGIDASLTGADKDVNVKAFLPLVRDFVKNKCNIFIFPEGKLAVRKDLDLHGRFQTGVASLINKILGVKKEVNVVPVGFAYGKGAQKGLNAINIGTPIVVKRLENSTTITKGDIEKKSSSVLYNFFDKHKDVEDIVITSEGKPVPQNEVIGYLKTILCENLEINAEIAEKKIEIPLDK